MMCTRVRGLFSPRMIAVLFLARSAHSLWLVYNTGNLTFEQNKITCLTSNIGIYYCFGCHHSEYFTYKSTFTLADFARMTRPVEFIWERFKYMKFAVDSIISGRTKSHYLEGTDIFMDLNSLRKIKGTIFLHQCIFLSSYKILLKLTLRANTSRKKVMETEMETVRISVNFNSNVKTYIK